MLPCSRQTLFTSVHLLFMIVIFHSTQGIPNSNIVRKLEDKLFKAYQRSVIPKKTLEKGVRVTLDLALNQIIDVNKRAQTMTTVLWVRQYWNDKRLRWNSTEYNDVESIVTQAGFLWLPDITLYNNAKHDYDIDKESFHSLTISSDGNISRYFPTIYQSSCKLDVRNFPFDDQVCTLKMGSWSYNINELDLYSDGNGDISSFIGNGEWILLRMPSFRHEIKFRCCPDPYVYLIYEIHIKRRSLYYFVNCFMPCLIMMALTVLSFYLPSETGERMGVGITVLLSLSIIQLILSDSLPPTSEVPLIVVYYGLTMLNIFMSLVFSCIVLTLYHHTAQPLPTWLRVSLCKWGARLMRMKQEWRKLEERRKEVEKTEKTESDVVAAKATVANWIPMTTVLSGEPITELVNRQNPSQEADDTNNDHILTKKFHHEDKTELFREEWRFASRVLNKLFMWIIVVAIFSNAVYVVVKAPTANLLYNDNADSLL